MPSPLISNSERDFLLQGCRDNCRTDGRTRTDTRPYTILINQNNNDTLLPLSNGSARLFNHDSSTHILCSVKAEMVHPSIQSPNSGVLEFHLDIDNNNNNNNNNNTASTRNEQETLQLTLSQLLLNHLVDLNELCIVPFHYVWRLHVDLYILNNQGGSILDACSHVIVAALKSTKLPTTTITTSSSSTQQDDIASSTTTSSSSSLKSKRPVLTVDSDIAHATMPPGIDKAPIIVTVTVLKCPVYTLENNNNNNNKSNTKSSGGKKYTTVLLLDANEQEEACAFAIVHVAIDERSNMICALAKKGTGAVPFSLLQDIMSFSISGKRHVELIVSNEKEDGVGSGSTMRNHHHHLLQDHYLIQQ